MSCKGPVQLGMSSLKSGDYSGLNHKPIPVNTPKITVVQHQLSSAGANNNLKDAISNNVKAKQQATGDCAVQNKKGGQNYKNSKWSWKSPRKNNHKRKSRKSKRKSRKSRKRKSRKRKSRKRKSHKK